ncbi:MAG: AEC family transporter [Ruminococcaceae bacterium]|nr:AEC family transporter [Oscillospiraceae bacterium]
MISLLLMLKIAQLFIIMIIGYIITKLKIVKGDDSLVMSKISLYVLLPAGIINAFNTEFTNSIKLGLLLAFLASIIIHIIFYVIDYFLKKTSKVSCVARASVMYSNAANLIIPIVSYVLGEEWVIYSCAYLSVQVIFLWTHAISMFKKEKEKNYLKIFTNPNIISIFIGLLMMLFNIKLPSLINDVAVSLSGMLGPVSMFITGMLFAKSNLKSVFVNKKVYIITFMRMIAWPLIVLVVFKILLTVVDIENAQKVLLITFLSSMTPTASTITQFAQIHNSDVDLAVSINIVTTVFCILTMPLLVSLYMM